MESEIFNKYMQKKFLILLVTVATLVGCSSIQKGIVGTYNIANCEYNYNSISGLTLSGIDLSNGISVRNIPKITTVLAGNTSSIPLNFTVNLDVKNPNQSEAMLHGLQYVLSIDGVQFTTGSLNRSLNIASGQTQRLPITVGVDLVTLMKTNSKDAVVNLTKNFIGMGSKKSQITLQLKPTFMIGNTAVPSPVYIPVSFNFGGE